VKILNVNSTLDPVHGGGTAERTRRLSAALARLGHHVTVLSSDLGLASEADRLVQGTEVVLVHCLSRRFNVPSLPLKQLLRLIGQYDVIHLSGHWSFLNAAVYLLATIARKPYAVTPAGALPIFGRSKALKFLYNIAVGKSLIRNADALIAITAAELPQFSEYGVNAAQVTVIPNGVDDDAFETVAPELFRSRCGLPDLRIVLFVGRLNPIKGPDLLLEAFATVAHRLPNYILVFAGPDDGCGSMLRQVAVDRGILDRVYFVGYIAGAQKVAAYRAATLVVIPSRQEAMSIVVLESGAAGVPVLITDQCGFDVIQEIGGGRVVGANASAIAEGLSSMLEHAEDLPQAGRNLSQLVRREFSWDAAANSLAKVLKKICGQ
jgi:glycosyltransferase involved in cell wall biosynthesis